MGIETNFSTYPVKTLESLRYPKLYVRESEDTFTHRRKRSYGFETTGVTRPIIIAELVKIMRETPEVCPDYETLGEMLTFIYNEKRRPEAMSGAHDDLVMSLAITYYVRHQQRFTLEDSNSQKGGKNMATAQYQKMIGDITGGRAPQIKF